MDDTDPSLTTLGLGVAGDISLDRLSELERFAEIGRLSASLLHEINNPLAAAMLWLEQCGNQQSPHIRQARSSMRLLQRYVEAARQQVRRESHYRNFCVQGELEQVRQILTPLAKRRGVKLQSASADGCNLYGDPVKFQQIIANLIQNAIDSYDNCPAGSRKLVHLQLRTCQGHLIIEVSDRGCGIARDQLAQLFKPFYTTKSGSGLGLGIGLFAVKRSIEKDFRGTISVKSSRGQGTRFIVRLKPASSDC